MPTTGPHSCEVVIGMFRLSSSEARLIFHHCHGRRHVPATRFPHPCTKSRKD